MYRYIICYHRSANFSWLVSISCCISYSIFHGNNMVTKAKKEVQLHVCTV